VTPTSDEHKLRTNAKPAGRSHTGAEHEQKNIVVVAMLALSRRVRAALAEVVAVGFSLLIFVVDMSIC
jgi:hypothetical protein